MSIVQTQQTNVWAGDGRAVRTREALREILRDVAGVADVRLLDASKRSGDRRSKVYVVLSAHDVERDRQIIQVLCQLEDVDMDLVPPGAEEMVPKDAESLLQ